MSNYKAHVNGSILRDDGAVIPRDPANLDYVTFTDWEKKGGVIAPADPVIVPPVVKDRIESLRDELVAKGVLQEKALDTKVTS